MKNNDLARYEKGKEELKETFMNIYYNSPRIMTVEIIAQNKYDNFDNEFEQNKDIGGVKREIISESKANNGKSYPEILKWRNEQLQYPDLFKSRWDKTF